MGFQPDRQREPDHSRPIASASAWDARRWDLIRRWAGVSAEDKLAWWFLWQSGRGNREQFVTTAEAVGEDQGTKGDAGRKRLKNLRERKLIECDHDRVRGTWLIKWVADPLELGDGPQAIEGDPQRTFWDESASLSERRDGHTSEAALGRQAAGDVIRPFRTGATDERPDDRPDVRRSTLTSRVDLIKNTSTSFTSEAGTKIPEGRSAQVDRRSSGGSAEGQPTKRAGDLVAAMAERFAPTPSEMVARLGTNQQQIETLAQWIQGKVNCPNMRLSPCIKVARWIVEGRLQQSDLDDVLFSLNEADRLGKIRGTRSQYFNGSLAKLERQKLDQDSLR